MEPFEPYRPYLFSVAGGMVLMAEGPLTVEWNRSMEWITSNREIHGVILASWSWHGIFFVNLPLCLIGIAATVRLSDH